MNRYLQFVILSITISFLSVSILFAQADIENDFNRPNKKGKLYGYWGWNVSSYSNSDISFRGDNYDFKLTDVVAKDRQTPWDASIYLNPGLITIPQTNFKLGYFISDHYSISVGVDHMKYVMVANQSVKINGHITNGSMYDGVYNEDDIVLTEEFLQFEHTDGLNYINVELNRFDDILKMTNRGMKYLEINTILGAGLGVLLPKTNAVLMTNNRHDDFHLSGYGLNAKIGLNVTFFKYFFVQGELKGGFIHMPDIRTTEFKSDKASQAFFFGQANILFGMIFKISNK